ncbi:MAG: glucose-6-phosphate dehydrogenase, partial [Acidobacteriota bacterium]|nr:glucose-6-phosphate dehydrogenase [Acidobacteriota bacterium]
MTQLERENPLRAGLTRPKGVEPATVVIFGASGDLTRRKLVPALYNLVLDGLLPASFALVGVARREKSDADFAGELREGVENHSRRPLDSKLWEEAAPKISYVATTFEDDDGYKRLADRLDAIDREQGTEGNRLFYLATPPSAFPVIIERLGRAGLNRPGKGGRWARVVIEKPVGRDLGTARELNDVVNDVFEESDVYRIDHYLGKETVQNLLVFRFANAIFEPLWNQKYVDHVQMTVAESIGVEGRGGYYEESGTTRDMLQNHMFQLLCLIAMEPPVSLEADAIRDEKVKVLRALRPIEPASVADETVRAQYEPGVVAGKPVPGYREEPGVSPGSTTETYVATRLFIDNWRWAGVPFYLRSGKRLTKRVTEVAMQFRDVPHRLFQTDSLIPNVLAMRIQPDEGITLKVDSKVPGNSSAIRPVAMEFRYGTSFGQEP